MWPLGAHDEARALVDEEVELAQRTEVPRAIGIALRVRGTLTGDRSDLAAAFRKLDVSQREELRDALEA